MSQAHQGGTLTKPAHGDASLTCQDQVPDAAGAAGAAKRQRDGRQGYADTAGTSRWVSGCWCCRQQRGRCVT
jgi:hypothetical protein